MLPIILSNEIKTSLLDYLETTFHLEDEVLSEKLTNFLIDQDHGIFKGPYVSVKLPFRKAQEGERNLEIAPPFTPYVHQQNAFQRLSGYNRQPQHTLVTTGTGSGKTECFTYPILDYCYHSQQKKGVKAIILYPMNALAADQAKRMAEMIFEDRERLGKIRVGMYVGGNGSKKSMGKDYVIDSREELKKNPPDILLTNYKMLDYLLIRPEDKDLWRYNEPDTLKYLILDELHTYDGAQGSDVANLIRRLKARLQVPKDSIAMIGTSATIASEDSDSVNELTNFASTIFGETFDRESVILEDRLDVSELFISSNLDNKIPENYEELDVQIGELMDSYIERQISIWFGNETNKLNLASQLLKRQLVFDIARIVNSDIIEINDLVEKVCETNNEFKKINNNSRLLVLQSILSLISEARIFEGKRELPFLQVQVQLWIREIRRLLRKVSTTPEFYWKDDVDESDKIGLPMYACRECGHSGWITYQVDGTGHFETESKSIYTKFFEDNRYIRYIYPNDSELQNEDGQMTLSQLAYLSPYDLSYHSSQNDSSDFVEVIITAAKESNSKPPKDLHSCPKCQNDNSLVIIGSQAASLASVAISQLYTSSFNKDKKLLVFTDSVQDASHRASFFESRTYRFNLRTAMQQIIDNSDEDIKSDSLFDIFYEYWTKEFAKFTKMPKQHFVATFMPPDLRYEIAYRHFINKRSENIPNELMDILRKRLSLEFIFEFGFNARIGRSLDKVQSSVMYLDNGNMDIMTEVIDEYLKENYSNLNVSKHNIINFIYGLLSRLKYKGGIDHPLLSRYRKNHGNTYILSKKQTPLMAPLGGSVPKFLTSDSSHKVFETYTKSGNRNTWSVDWFERTISRILNIQQMNDIYEKVLHTLVQQNLLNTVEDGNKINYGINSEKLYITTHTISVKCNHCGYNMTIAEKESEIWIGSVCRKTRCKGTYEGDSSSKQSYYKTLYSTGNIQRIFAEEHTGLLDRRKRETVERQFKANENERYADAPNLLTCTPTLEMGIDVGDLSATMLNSVPPGTANYVQRVGRAGRKTGNALLVTMVKSQPHDLYFNHEPLLMMKGHVQPPGSYLDAPEILKRHYLAYCLDSWSRDSNISNLPNKVSLMLSQYQNGGFPLDFINYYKNSSRELFEKFADIYGEDISEQNNVTLLNYVRENGIENSLINVLEKVEEEIEVLNDLNKKLLKEIKTIENTIEYSKDSLEDRLQEVLQEQSVIYRMLQDYKNMYPLELFTNEGLLPNYAFPEGGIKLKAIIRKRQVEDGEKPFDIHEVIRPAKSALKEFAPYNVFYASKRKISINQIDIGTKGNSLIENWRFCSKCFHIENDAENHWKDQCPKCGSLDWQDQGQVKKMVRLKEFQAKTNELDSSTNNESDERDMLSYQIQHFFDIPTIPTKEAIVNEEIVFGFEYHKNVKLREVNFSFQQNLNSNNEIFIAGKPFSKSGFKVCKECGIVKAPEFLSDVKTPNHSYRCSYKDSKTEECWSDLVLYRDLESEAIKILLPVSAVHQPEKLYSFKAALQLGLRKWYKGDPGHLLIKLHSEPLSSEENSNNRNYLIIYDEVPGGTGYLANLIKNNLFFEVLRKAYDAICSCGCQKEGKKGCYKCLYAYQTQMELPYISASEALEMLKPILDKESEFIPLTSLADVKMEILVESELEALFIDKLKSVVSENGKDNWKEVNTGEKPVFEFTLNNKEWWYIEPQVNIGKKDGVEIASKPDFIIYPIFENMKPIAVFADGYKYHVQPDEETAVFSQDILKRNALIASDKFFVWTVTWDDFQEDNKLNVRILDENEFIKLNGITNKFKLSITDENKDLFALSKFNQLLLILKYPLLNEWKTYIIYILLSCMEKRPKISNEMVKEESINIVNSIYKPNYNIIGDSMNNINNYIVKNKLNNSDLLSAFYVFTDNFIQEMRKVNLSELIIMDECHISIRIEDIFTYRKNSDFKRDWHAFWSMVNIMQFNENLKLSSSELATQYQGNLYEMIKRKNRSKV